MRRRRLPGSLPPELRHLVKWSGVRLGKVIERELGQGAFRRIEKLRSRMAGLRGRDSGMKASELASCLEELRDLDRDGRLAVARAFAMLLELMNACENAYRSHRLRDHRCAEMDGPLAGPLPTAVVYVLTSHPTEARAPQNIAIFRKIERTLLKVLAGERSTEALSARLGHQLALAWRIAIVRARAPRVKDEAEHIYSILFDEAILTAILESGCSTIPVYIRTWAGGDKDGHPGVDEKAMLASLSLSRAHIIRFIGALLARTRTANELVSRAFLRDEMAAVARDLAALKRPAAGDADRVRRFRDSFRILEKRCFEEVGARDPHVARIRRLLSMFPALVVPLELRESSDVLMAAPGRGRKPAIDRMLGTLERIARGGDPRWYARGLIVSMTGSISHIRAAAAKVRFVFGECLLPVIPLFEEVPSLDAASVIVRQMARDRSLKREIREIWGGQLEIMVGYSDSAKESGVFPSRLAIARAMNDIDSFVRAEGLRPVFFQGSGGSVDRGGGTVGEQTAWWPRSALMIYKVTVQGEMVERSLATPEIARGQILNIIKSVSAALAQPSVSPHHETVKEFAGAIARAYEAITSNPGFLEMVGKATPYAHLNDLKFGSRPANRTKAGAAISVRDLRAIPWVLCWTQTRTLFPTWWGVGTAWRGLRPRDRGRLRAAFAREPVFASFVRALGFTFAKVELSVWSVYLRESGLDPVAIARFERLFTGELRSVREFIRFVTGRRDPLWFRPWLAESIRLRSPMIHPLNLLQIIALQDRDTVLLRNTVTGIASGMLTTG